MYLKDLTEKLSGKSVVFTFGRMNPPTIGHEKLINRIKAEARKKSADWKVYLSSTQDYKKNPLSFERKIHYAKKMFGREVNEKNFPQEITALHAIVSLYEQGYKSATMVVGSDRVSQFDKLLKTYNGVEGKPHGYYNFENLDVISAGDRDPDAEGVSGMSASKLRDFAVKGQFEQFQQGLPGLSEKDAKSLFNEIRKGLKLQSIKEKLRIKTEVSPEKVAISEFKFSDTFKTEKIPEDIDVVLRRKSEVSGIAYSILKSIYEKAVKKYKLGHEIGQVKEQFAIQQVNQHLLNSKAMNDINEDFKLWMKMNEATDVVVSTPTGKYTTKTDSVSRTKTDIRNKFRTVKDRSRVSVRRATPRDQRYTDREPVEEMMSRPHVFVGVKDTDPTSNLRPSVSYRPGKSNDFISIKPVDTNFFNENLKDLVNSPYEFLEELGLHTNFGILIRDKGNEKAMVNAIAKKKSFSTSGYHGDKVYAVDTNENRLRKTLESAIQEEAPPGREHQVKSLKKKVGEKKAYAFAWAQHNKHGLPDKKEEVELKEWEFDPNTLLQQLGGNKFMVMTGAKDLMVDKTSKSLHMKIGRNSAGINHLKITLEPDDTYTMDFGRIRKLDYKVIRSIKGVYAEALQDVFTEVTGMYTSL